MTVLIRILSPRVGLHLGVLSAAILALAACERGALQSTEQPNETGNEMKWARAALARNPQLEVVATDQQSGVITVRRRSTGEVQALKLADLAAAPLADLKMAELRAAEPQSAVTSAPATPAQEAATPAPATESRAAEDARPAARDGSPQVAATSNDNYKIERAGGQVRVTGPGVSIVSAGANAAAGSASEGEQQTAEPIICEGHRMVQLDNRTLVVDGDAIIARGGCELYITNSRIVASGTGIVVHDARVHVSNSHIEGANGAFEADDRARLYVRGSTFKGVPRRTELAMVQDQGGNRWR